jgi:hypothetical protein
MTLKEIMEEHDMMSMDGYDDCIVGYVERFGQPPILCYDRAKIIGKLMSDGMDEVDAEEWFEFNQIGAWVGDTTPCFITMNSADT